MKESVNEQYSYRSLNNTSLDRKCTTLTIRSNINSNLVTYNCILHSVDGDIMLLLHQNYTPTVFDRIINARSIIRLTLFYNNLADHVNFIIDKFLCNRHNKAVLYLNCLSITPCDPLLKNMQYDAIAILLTYCNLLFVCLFI